MIRAEGFVIFDKRYKYFLNGWAKGSESIHGARIYKTKSMASRILNDRCRRLYESPTDDYEIIKIEIKEVPDE